jgi:hypothetical protein
MGLGELAIEIQKDRMKELGGGMILSFNDENGEEIIRSSKYYSKGLDLRYNRTLLPENPKILKKLVRGFKRNPHGAGCSFLKYFNYKLEIIIDEKIRNKDIEDIDLDFLRQLTGFYEGSRGNLIQEMLIDALDLRGHRYRRYIKPTENGFRIEKVYRVEELRDLEQNPQECMEDWKRSFQDQIKDLLNVAKRYFQSVSHPSLDDVRKKLKDFERSIGGIEKVIHS